MDSFRNIRDDGVQKVANAAARLALLPPDGYLIEQLDDNSLWGFHAANNSWVEIGSGGGGGGSFTSITGTPGEIAYFDASGHGTGDSLATRDPTTKYSSIGSELPAGGQDSSGQGKWFANNQGAIGNGITLVFNGTTDTYGSVTAAWNAANPLNQITLVQGSSSFVPGAQTIQFYGGGPSAIFTGAIPFINTAGYGSGTIMYDATSNNFAGEISGNLGISGTISTVMIAGTDISNGPDAAFFVLPIGIAGTYSDGSNDSELSMAGSGVNLNYTDSASDQYGLQFSGGQSVFSYQAGSGENGNLTITGGQLNLYWNDISGNAYGILAQSGAFSIINQNTQWNWPLVDSAGPWLSDGNGNGSFSQNFVFNDGTSPDLAVGDVLGAGNHTSFSLDDGGSAITLQTNGSVTTQDQYGNRYFYTDVNFGGYTTTSMGDIQGIKNSNTLTVDDGNNYQGVVATVSQQFNIQNSQSGSIIFSAEVNYPNPSVYLGDIQYAGNGTQFGLSDSSETIDLTANNGVTVYGNNLNVEGSIYLYSNGLYQGVSQSLGIQSVNGNTTLDLIHYSTLVDASSGPVTITLPSGSQYTGIIYNIKKTDSSVHAVTISSSASIDGSSTQTLITQFQTIRVQYDGTNWWKI